MKRFFSFLLTLTLCISLLTAFAMASSDEIYEIYNLERNADGEQAFTRCGSLTLYANGTAKSDMHPSDQEGGLGRYTKYDIGIVVFTYYVYDDVYDEYYEENTEYYLDEDEGCAYWQSSGKEYFSIDDSTMLVTCFGDMSYCYYSTITFDYYNYGTFTYPEDQIILLDNGTGYSLSLNVISGNDAKAGQSPYRFTAAVVDSADTDSRQKQNSNTKTEMEPNNTLASATALTLNALTDGELGSYAAFVSNHTVPDEDWYSVYLSSGVTYTFYLDGYHSTFANTSLSVYAYNANGSLTDITDVSNDYSIYIIGRLLNNSGTDSISFTVPVSGTYYFRLWNYTDTADRIEHNYSIGVYEQ